MLYKFTFKIYLLISLDHLLLGSGLSINLDKTLGMGIGTLAGITPEDMCRIKWSSGPITRNKPKIPRNTNFDPKNEIYVRHFKHCPCQTF